MRDALRFVRAWSAIILCTSLFGLLATLILVFGFSPQFCHRFCGQRWGRWILRGSGIAVRASGLERLDLTRPHVFMFNHMSYFTFFAIAATFPCQWRGIMRREFLYIPFCWVLFWAGHIFVNLRKSPRSIRELGRAVSRIQGGISVFISPEGRRTGPEELAPFKSGGFILAIQAGVPIVPITFLEDRQQTTPPLHFVPHTINVIIHEPVPTTGLSLRDKDALKDRVREAIRAGFPSHT